MKPVQRSEILPLGDYESIRGRFRDRVIEEKKRRRVQLGDHISAVFENRDTVLLQIQEMLRTERITKEAAIEHEIRTYNELVPGDNELSLTLFVEIADKELRERTLVELAGLEDQIAIEVDGQFHRAVSPERDGAEPGRTTAVHYFKVPLPAPFAPSATVVAVVDHPAYQQRRELPAVLVADLASDLREPS